MNSLTQRGIRHGSDCAAYDVDAFSQYIDPETGLIYLRNRYYNPDTAQFLTRDPLDSVTRSAYGYVEGNPLNSSDPSGLSKCGQFSLGGLVDCAANVNPMDAVHGVGAFVNGARRGDCSTESSNLQFSCAVGGVTVKVEVVLGTAAILKGLPYDEGVPGGPKPPGYNPNTWDYREASRQSVSANSYWDPAGGEWHWHGADPWHDPHWDYNPWDHVTPPWQHIYLDATVGPACFYE